MRIPATLLVIFKITLVLTNSQNDINSTETSQDESTESTNIETTSITSVPNTDATSTTTITRITPASAASIISSNSTSAKILTNPTLASSSPSLNLSTTGPFFSSFCPDDLNDTKILTKKGLDLRNHADKSIQIASPVDGDFLTLIRDSSLWVDKSLLIRKIWDGLWASDVVVTAPPKWGKTINLSMFKFYSELPLDSNGFETPKNQSASYLYFNEGKILTKDGTIEELNEPPLISGYKEHLGSYPVIYMSGANLDMDNTLESFQTMIHNTYRRHESLLNRLNIAYSKASSKQRPNIFQNLTQFREFYEPDNIRQLNETYLISGIQILSKLLFNMYRRKVLVLFDDYDRFAHKAYFEGANSSDLDNGTRFVNTWEIFLRDTFKKNRHLERAIMNGVLKAHDPCSLPGFPNFYNAYVFDDEDLFPYYGFFDKEVAQLAAEKGIEQYVDNITRWYGGYRTLSHLNFHMYSPYSVVQFMNTLHFQVYWPTSSLSRFINRLLEKPEFQQRIRGMVEAFAKGKKLVSSVFYRLFKGLALNDYAEMRKIDLDETKYYGLHEDTVFSLLAFSGYVGVFEQNRGQINALVEIPNREIYNQISSKINSR